MPSTFELVKSVYIDHEVEVECDCNFLKRIVRIVT